MKKKKVFKWSVSSGSYSVVHLSLFRIFHLNSAEVYENSIICHCVSFHTEMKQKKLCPCESWQGAEAEEKQFSLPCCPELGCALPLSCLAQSIFFLPFLWRLNLSHCEWEPLRDSRFCNGSSSVPARLSFIFNFLPICGPRTNNETADGKRRRLLSTFPIKFGHLKWDFIFFIFSTAGYTRWNICLVTHIGSLVQPELFKIYLFCLKEGWLFSYQSCRNAGWHKRTPKTEISFFVNPSQTFSVEIISPWLFPQHLTQIHIIPSPFFCPFASQLSDLLLYHPPVFPRLSFSLSSGLPSHPSPLPSLSAFCSHKKVR